MPISSSAGLKSSGSIALGLLISMTPVLAAPTVENLTVSVAGGEKVCDTIYAQNPGGGIMQFHISTKPAEGSVRISEAYFCYTARKYTNATRDSFVYSVTDGVNGISYATVSVQITPFVSKIDGMIGNETLNGTVGRDVITALGGNDFIKDNAGNDIVDAGEGDDRVQRGSGNDSYDGGVGTDTLDLSKSNTTMLYFETSFMSTPSTGEKSVVKNFENVITSDYGDTLVLNDLANTVKTGNGKDILTLQGGSDFVYFSLGRDNVNGGSGVDTVSLEYAATGYDVFLDDADIFGRNALDMSVYKDFENVIGSPYDDYIVGSTEPNIIFGGAGNDRILVASFGKSNSMTDPNIISGGPGNDTVAASNAGKTIILFAPGDINKAYTETVFSFDAKTDKLNFRAQNAKGKRFGFKKFIGSAKFSGKGKEIRYSKGFVEADENGDKLPDFKIQVYGYVPTSPLTLTASNFML